MPRRSVHSFMQISAPKSDCVNWGDLDAFAVTVKQEVPANAGSNIRVVVKVTPPPHPILPDGDRIIQCL